MSFDIAILSVVVGEYLRSVYTDKAVVMGEALTEGERKEGLLRGSSEVTGGKRGQWVRPASCPRVP